MPLERWSCSLRVRAPHFASKVSYNAGAATEGDEYWADKHELKIQQGYVPKRWSCSLCVRGPHFASKVSYNAGAATEGDEYWGRQVRVENPTRLCPWNADHVRYMFVALTLRAK